MHIATVIYTFLFGKFVGKDEYGNSYYRSKSKNNDKRWVMYKGISEATKVPPLWHRWLHKITDCLPNEINTEKYNWEKQHLANFTGTSKSYKPEATNRKSYTAWQPQDN